MNELLFVLAAIGLLTIIEITVAIIAWFNMSPHTQKFILSMLLARKEMELKLGREDILDSTKRFLVIDLFDLRLTKFQRSVINYLLKTLRCRPFHRATLVWRNEFGKFTKYTSPRPD